MNNNQSSSQFDKEWQEFADAITPEAADPSPLFIANLGARLQKEAPQSNILSSVKMFANTTKAKLALFSGSLAVMLVLAGGVGFGYYLWRNTTVLPNSDQLLADIAAANSSFRNNSGNSRGGAEIATMMAPAADQKMSLMIYREKSFNSSTEQVTKGPAQSKCFGGDPYAKLSSYTRSNADYQAKDGKYYAKFELRDGNNQVIDYALTKPGEVVYYRGGSYAVKVTNQPSFMPLAATRESLSVTQDSIAPVSGPVVGQSEPAVVEGSAGSGNTGTGAMPTDPAPQVNPEPSPEPAKPDVESLFGTNAKVIGEVTENGKQYYVVTWEMTQSCTGDAVSVTSDSNAKDPNAELIITRALAQKDNLQIAETSLYLNAIADGNLITKSRIASESRNAELSEISSSFNDLNGVQIKTFDYRDYQAKGKFYDAEMRKQLANLNVSTLVPTAPIFTNKSIYSGRVNTRTYESFWTDAAFYGNSAASVDMRNQENSWRNNTEAQRLDPELILNASSKDGLKSLSVSSYNAGTKANELAANHGFQDLKGQTSKIKVNGIEQNVQLYTQNFEKIADCPDCTPQFIIVLERAEATYVATYNGFKDIGKNASVIAAEQMFNQLDESKLTDIINLFETQNPLIAI